MAESRIPSTAPGISLTQRFPFFYGWVILGVASLAMLSAAPGQTFVVSVFVDPMRGDLELSRTLISGIYTAATLTGAACLPLMGRLLDRYGARVMLTSVALVFGLVAFSMGFVDNPLHLFFAFAGLRLLGQGSMSLISTTLVALWFSRFRARATSISVIGTATGQVAVPPLAHLLISTIDWRWTWRVLGLIILSMLVAPVFTFVRRSPESIGTFPDGIPPKGSTQSDGPSLPASNKPSSADWSLKEVLRLPGFWLLLLVASFPTLTMTALIFHQVSILGDRGIDSGIASASLSVAAMSFLVGSIGAGLLADALPNRYILSGTSIILGAAILLVMNLSGNLQALGYGVVLGAGMGTHLTVGVVIWANYYGRTHLGSIRGMASMCSVAFSALGPLPVGLLYDLTDTYTLPLLLMLAASLAGAVAATVARPPRRK